MKALLSNMFACGPAHTGSDETTEGRLARVDGRACFYCFFPPSNIIQVINTRNIVVVYIYRKP